ncbi:MAG: HipA domain-containing protein [Acidimicrobiales bacterium]
MAKSPLHCWWGDDHVADFTPNKGRGWDLRCKYTPGALERWATGMPALSCSLLVQSRAIDASQFLKGLLPEGAHLQALASLAGVPTNDTYSLLARYGRDVAGALIITAGDQSPSDRKGSVEPYSGDALDQEVAGLGEHSLGVRNDSELSIAGLQNKLLLVKLKNGKWGRPVHGYPSTHILKLDDERYPGLVDAEAACLTLAHALGLAETKPITTVIGDKRCLITARYDRGIVKGHILRIHQEDACQALGVNLDEGRGRGKYESHGGPTFAQIAKLLRVHSNNANAGLERLAQIATFTVLIGNADGHGKNVSFLHDTEGSISLAPLYDTVPTMLWPKLRATSAMSVSGKVDFNKLHALDVIKETSRWGLDPGRSAQVVQEFTETLVATAPSVMSDERLVTKITRRAEQLIRG